MERIGRCTTRGVRPFAAALLALIVLLASGCAALDRHEQIDFETAKDLGNLSPRASAQPTTSNREQLIQNDYFEVGSLTVELTVEECPGSERGPQCKAIPHEGTATQLLLREAADRGGDLVQLIKQDERVAAMDARQGRCLRSHNVQRYVSVPIYVTECRTIMANQLSCSERQSGSRLELRTVSECASWEQIYIALTKSTSSGVVWRHDPVYAQDDRLRLVLERGNRREVVALVPDRETANRPLLNGDLPVHVAVKAENADAMAVLVERGVELDEAAVLKALQSPRLLRVLLGRNANVNTVYAKGKTALMAVAETGTEESVELARMLLKRGANVNLVDQWGNTALMMAAGGGSPSHVDIVRLLIKHGADVNALDNTSSTALMDAARGGTKIHLETVKLLLEHGADRTLRNMRGSNAYDHIPRDISKELRDEFDRLLGGSAALTRTPTQKLDEAPVQHGQRFEVAVEVPPPWTKTTEGGPDGARDGWRHEHVGSLESADPGAGVRLRSEAAPRPLELSGRRDAHHRCGDSAAAIQRTDAAPGLGSACERIAIRSRPVHLDFPASG